MPDYPCLARTETDEKIPLPGDGSSVVIGRAEDADYRIDAKTCSRRQVAVHRRGGAYFLEAVSTTVPTVLDGRVVQTEAQLDHGARFRFGEHEFTLLTSAEMPAAPLSASELEDGTFLHGDSDAVMTVMGQEGEEDADLPDGRIVKLDGPGIIGRGSEVSYRLAHPRVSRHHAEVRLQGGQVAIRDLGSANGTFVNGVQASRLIFLKSGDRVDIGPFLLVFRGDRFVQTSRQGNLEMVAKGLSRTVPDRAGGGMLKILDDVSLVIPPRQLVALIGPSGSGKSTLMNALSARAPADEGSVLVNGVDLYANFESMKQGMALVPQDEVLHEALRVEEAVGFTARLRLPSDTGPDDIRQVVRSSLEQVDLAERARNEVRNLSGGQRKRACLANETVHDPNLLFVDEVTSGLDEQTDQEIMRLLRRSADRGMTVVCVTHTLSNVEEFCHKIVVMTNPGVLAFYGSPAECLQYFGVARLSEVYGVLAGRDGSHWKRQYLASAHYQRHIGPELEHAERSAADEPQEARSVGKELKRRLPEIRRQLWILTQRANRLLLTDKKTLAIGAAQSLTIGLVLALVFHGLVDAERTDGRWFAPAGEDAGFLRSQTALLFMLGISCFWFGCSNASKEIVKERVIYKCERDVNLSVPSYLLSKLFGLTCLGLAQVAILFVIVGVFTTIPGGNLGQLVMMSASVLTGTSLGLLISSATSTRDQATTLVPILLIPQIVMSGVIVPEMPLLADLLAQWFISGYWVVDGMKSGAPTLQENGRLLLSYPELGGVLGRLFVLGVHFVVYLTASLVVLVVRDSRGGLYGAGVKSWIRAARAGST